MTIEITFALTSEEAVNLEDALYRRGREDMRLGIATKDNTMRERGSWLLGMGDLVKGQHRSQLKFDPEGGEQCVVS